MEARAGNSILDFETLFSDFQELLNGSGLRNKSVWAHKWVWAQKSGESLWTHNAPPEPAEWKIAVQSKICGNFCWLKFSDFPNDEKSENLSQLYLVAPDEKSEKLRQSCIVAPDEKSENLSQQKVLLISLASAFPYCGLGRGVVGSERFSPFPSPHSETASI